MITLKNDILSIKVDRHGAELWSIRDHSGREFIWQADPAFWKRHAPVLFPIVGSLWDKKYRVDGKEYSLEQHGFARDMDFHLVSSDENTLWYELKSDAETLAKYPYAFTLKIGYKLTGNKIQVMWEVSNNDGKTMYFQIGAHPAFYYPDFNPDLRQLKKYSEKILSSAMRTTDVKARHAESRSLPRDPGFRVRVT